jgi:hypothetical protein
MSDDLAEIFGAFIGVLLFVVVPIVLVLLAVKWIFF